MLFSWCYNVIYINIVFIIQINVTSSLFIILVKTRVCQWIRTKQHTYSAVDWRIQCEKCINLINKSTNCRMNSLCSSPYPFTFTTLVMFALWIGGFFGYLGRSDNIYSIRQQKLQILQSSTDYQSYKTFMLFTMFSQYSQYCELQIGVRRKIPGCQQGSNNLETKTGITTPE